MIQISRLLYVGHVPHVGGASGDLEVQGRGFDGLGEWAQRSIRQSLAGRHRPTGGKTRLNLLDCKR